jgi:GNAT superfamily N-acetyltransferase
MLQQDLFDQTFLGVACYRLVPPIEPSDLAALNTLRGEESIFASTKIDASDDAMANTLEQLGYRRICKQIVLRARLDGAARSTDEASITARLDLDPVDVRAHAAQFDSGRFRQDRLIATDAAIEFYAAWVRNSTHGAKRVASINRNFASFEDRAGVRWIDLLSVLDRGEGIALRLVGAIIEDARRSSLQEVKVVTDGNNMAALRAYRKAGFEPERSLMVFHLFSDR